MSRLTVLLTGATGFIGSHLLEALLKQGYQMVILKRSTSNLCRIAHLERQYKSYDVDIQPIEQAFVEHQIDCVIHTASHYGRNGNPISEIVESNLMFGLRILDTCLKFDVKTFINTDTFFNNPNFNQKYLGAYTMSKKHFVDWLQSYSVKFQVVNLKLQHVYGPKDDSSKFIPWFVSQLKQKAKEIELTSGNQKRDFIFVEDVVSAYLTILKNTSSISNFQQFDVGTGESLKLSDFLNQLVDFYRDCHLTSKTTLVFGAKPEREGEIMDIEVDNSGLKRLGWEIRTTRLSAFEKLLEL